MNRIGLLLFAIAASGCAKFDDVGRAQEEGAYEAKAYVPRIDELSRRAELVGRADLPADARPLLSHVRGLLQEARTHVSSAPTRLATAAQSGRVEEVLKVSNSIEHAVDHELTEATDGLGSLESWVAIDEARPKTKAAAAPAPVGSEPSDPPPPPP